jgi:hypothetical protein
MAEGQAQPPVDVEQLIAELKERVEKERAAGAYADDLSGFGLQIPPLGEGASVPRVRFRPELGFSSKPVIGPVITGVKRFYLRMLFYVFDDLAQQTDAALARLEAALFVEVASRERLEGEVRELKAQLDRMRPDEKPGDRP